MHPCSKLRARTPFLSTVALPSPPVGTAVDKPAGSVTRPAGTLWHRCGPEAVAMLMILLGLAMIFAGPMSLPTRPTLRGSLAVEAEARP